MVFKECTICNKVFYKKITTCKNEWSNRKYCSKVCCDKDKIGKVSWNKGVSPSPETKQKISKKLTGRKIPREIVEKIRRRKGPLNNKWKGGITPENKLIRQSPQYKQWRTAVFERDNYTCVHCRTRSGIGNKVILEADHIKPFAVFKELRFDIDNGRTLCQQCHRKTETWGIKAKCYQC